MKKLLSLLSVLTIGGTSVPTTIAASIYQKEEHTNALNLQTSNLETLNRTKRENNNLFSVNVDNALKINVNIRNHFKDSHNKVFRALIQADILRVIFNNVDQPGTSADAIHDNNEIVLLNKNTNYNGFIVPVIIEENSQSRKIELVFRTRDLYLEGFIVNNNYYYFSTADIKFISNVNSIPLGFKSDYIDLFVDGNGNRINLNINWNIIANSFKTLINYQGENNIYIRNSLGIIAVVVAENWRFITMNDLINKKIIENNQYIFFGTDINDPNNLYQIAMDWSAQGASVLSTLQHRWSGIQSLPYNHYFDENHQIRLESFLALPYDDQHNQNILLNQQFLRNWRAQNPQKAWKKDHEIKKEIIKKWRNNWSGWFKDNILRYLPINVYSNQIYNRHIVRILFLIAINYAFNSCHKDGSDLKKRDINQELNQEFCDLQSDVSKIKGDIIFIQILDENINIENRQVGDAYVRTTEGLYLIRNNNGEVLKLEKLMDCDYKLIRISSLFSLQNYCSNENVRNIRSANGQLQWGQSTKYQQPQWGQSTDTNQQQIQQQIQQIEQQIQQLQLGQTTNQQSSYPVYKDEPIYNNLYSNKLAPSAPNKNWGTCLPISNENPYFDRNKDRITWYSRFPAHAGIKLFLSLKTAQVIEKIFFERNKYDFKSYLVSLFEKIPSEGNLKDDFPILANCIFQGFSEFHDKVLELEKMNNDNKRIVVEIHANFKNFDFSHSSSGSEVNVFGTSVNAIYII